MDGTGAPKGADLRWGGDRTRAAIIAVVTVFIGLYWLNVWHELRKNEAAAMEVARHRAVFTAHAAAESVETTLDRFRVTLNAAAVAAGQGQDALALYGQAVSAGADDMIFQLFYVDAEGYLAFTTLGPAPRNYLGDRDYFKELAADPQLPMVISPPILGRLTKKWSLQVAKAVTIQGRFAGVVAVAVSPDRWTEGLAKFEANDSDVLTLFSREGIYLLRTRDTHQSYGQHLTPARPFLAGDAADSGNYVERGQRDGVSRLYAWQRLSSGHVLVSGIGLEAALAPARDLNRQIIVRGGGATFLLVLALAVIAYFSRRSDRVSRAIAEQEYRQRVTLSVMAEGLAVVMPTGEITFHNESFARILPYPPERLRRAGGFLAWDVLDQDGNPIPQENYPSMVTARTGHPLDNVTLGIRTPQGDTRWLNANARPLLRAGKPYAAILTVADITLQRHAEKALKESEERYRAVVNSLMEGIVVHDAHGVIVACNPAAERIFARSHEDLVGGSPTSGLWRTVHADGTPCPGEENPALITLRTGQGCNGVVLGLLRADGGITWIEINTAPLAGADGAMPAGVVASVLDITHRKEFEDELSRSNTELEQFAYAVSHDLREPLRMVASYIQLLERRLGDAATDEIREFVGFAVDGAKRMDRMLVALLEYSRVGRLGMPMEWVHSRRVLDEALLFLSPVIQQSGADISVHGDWPEIYASSDEIERLFQNLVGNALKYHAEGVAPVIRVTAGQEESGAWKFTFQDHGIGIAADQVSRLFKVFQRLHASDRYEGSGVGLALCRKIVQRHEGRIWVESPGPDQGSSFIFTLPGAKARRPGL